MTPPSSTGPAALVGRVVGQRYHVLSLLGEGGMGAVFVAEQLDLGRRVAVKVLRRRYGPPELARFRREAEATARLAHPNIVTLIDFIAAEGEPPAMVMELLQGASLRSELERVRRLPPARAIAIARQVLSALAAAHAAGVVHRDIKPGNVFLAAGGPVHDFVKVLDFGVAKVEDGAPLSEAGEILGTPAYMAPEQVMGGPVDPRTDVYGAGALLYAMLTGGPPADTRRGLAAVVTEPPRDVRSIEPAVPPALAAIVHRALEKNAHARFGSADEMSRALATVVTEGPITAPPPTPATLSAPPAQPSGGSPSHPRTLESPAMPAMMPMGPPRSHPSGAPLPGPTPPGPRPSDVPPPGSAPAPWPAQTPPSGVGGRGGTAASPVYPGPPPPERPPLVTVEPARYVPPPPARKGGSPVALFVVFGLVGLVAVGGVAAAIAIAWASRGEGDSAPTAAPDAAAARPSADAGRATTTSTASVGATPTNRTSASTATTPPTVRPTPTPSPSPSPSPSPTPSAAPTPSPSPTPSPTPTPAPTPSPSPTPSATPAGLKCTLSTQCPANMSCIGGACACPNDGAWAMCAGKCVQMNLNPRDNCGACGKVCTGEEICNAKSLDWHDSRCVSCVDKGREQGANLHRCGGNTCINFDSLENCGGCGKVCRTRCTRGVCEP